MFENTQPSDGSMQTPPPPPPMPGQTPPTPQFGNDRGAEDIFAESEQPMNQPQGGMMPTGSMGGGTQPVTPFAEPRSGGMGKRLGVWIAVLVVVAGAGAALYFFTDLFNPTVNVNDSALNTNLTLNTNSTTNTTTNLNTNSGSFNTNGNTNTTTNSNDNSNTNTTANTNSNVDTDNDGLTDAEEFSLGTLINNRDSDNDGLSDYAEVKFYSTDPLNTDTDGDGFSDGSEVENGYNPNGPGKL